MEKKKTSPGSASEVKSSSIRWVSCREVVSWLGAYVEGELAEEDCQALVRHLRLCPPCGEFLLQYKVQPRLVSQVMNESDRRHVMSEAATSRLMDFLHKNISQSGPCPSCQKGVEGSVSGVSTSDEQP